MGKDWPRPIVHWAIEALDPEKVAGFYRELFNWEVGDGPIMSIEAGVGGPEPGPAGHIQPSNKSAVSLYVQVRDLRETLDRATTLGGSILMEPFDLPGQPTLAGIADPEGNTVMLVQQ